MVLLCNSLLRKCAPEQMSWSSAERAILCTTKKFVKSVSARITSQPIQINGKSSAYFLSLFLFWCDASSWRVVRHRTFHQELKKQALHFTCLALYADRTMHRNCSVSYSSQKFWCAFFLDSSPGSLLSASRFGMAIWNDWKRKSSRQEVTRKSGNWTKRYDWSAG